MTNKAKVIAIDGPSGSGKSTIAKAVAKKLALIYIDTGAMFRSIAWGLNDNKIEDSDLDRIKDFLNTFKFEYAPAENILVRLNGTDLTTKIRQHEVSALASKYSKISEIRDFLKSYQRELISSRAGVLEGRDIGTIVFPDAALKIFLTASSKVRAHRRYEQLKELGLDTKEVSVESIAKDIELRDKSDSQRAIAPLVQAQDAIHIDTSDLTTEEVILKVIDLYHERKDLF